ncbi:hypothetical protein SEA_GIBBLES_43 [Gordonia phage Gibbles]|nr:hypothetical protein SEA_GIBBLES_43 [Gordonia phage Gibbles]
MKNIQPVTFTGGNEPDETVMDFRPKAVEPDPKDSFALGYVNESPPEKTQLSRVGQSTNTEESSIHLVSPSQLENSLQDVWEDDVNAGREEKLDEQN